MTKVDQLLSEYSADPNCWPELWISSEDVTADEKAEFIKRAVQSITISLTKVCGITKKHIKVN